MAQLAECEGSMQALGGRAGGIGLAYLAEGQEQHGARRRPPAPRAPRRSACTSPARIKLRTTPAPLKRTAATMDTSRKRLWTGDLSRVSLRAPGQGTGICRARACVHMGRKYCV